MSPAPPLSCPPPYLPSFRLVPFLSKNTEMNPKSKQRPKARRQRKNIQRKQKAPNKKQSAAFVLCLPLLQGRPQECGRDPRQAPSEKRAPPSPAGVHYTCFLVWGLGWDFVHFPFSSLRFFFSTLVGMAKINKTKVSTRT